MAPRAISPPCAVIVERRRAAQIEVGALPDVGLDDSATGRSVGSSPGPSREAPMSFGSRTRL